MDESEDRPAPVELAHEDAERADAQVRRAVETCIERRRTPPRPGRRRRGQAGPERQANVDEAPADDGGDAGRHA